MILGEIVWNQDFSHLPNFSTFSSYQANSLILNFFIWNSLQYRLIFIILAIVIFRPSSLSNNSKVVDQRLIIIDNFHITNWDFFLKQGDTWFFECNLAKLKCSWQLDFRFDLLLHNSHNYMGLTLIDTTLRRISELILTYNCQLLLVIF